jgi:hypothetical protein
MPAKRKSSDARPKRIRSGAVDDRRIPPIESPTAIAAEMLRTGVVPHAARRNRGAEIPSEDETILVGDPDDTAIANEYNGEDTPGGSSTTPDQNDVDAIGKAYGLQEEDSGALRSAGEVLAKRDRHRPELTPRRRRV